MQFFRSLPVLLLLSLGVSYAFVVTNKSVGADLGPGSAKADMAMQKVSRSAISAIRSEGDAEYVVPERSKLESPVQTFSSVIECLDRMDADDTQSALGNPKLLVVLFYAHYCKLCHKANIPYKKMAYANSDIKFSRLETSILTSKQLRSLGISRVPFVQIYRSGICVASFSTKWQLESKLTEALRQCQNRSPQDWDAFIRLHGTEIEDNLMSRKKLREETSLAKLSPTSESLHEIQSLSTEGQLIDTIDHTSTMDQNALTVVMFHSHFETACVRAQHQYRRLVERHQRQVSTGTSSPPIRWAKIEASILSDTTLADFGIHRYPHVQIYRGRICVASFSIPQTYYFDKIVSDSLETVQSRSPEEWSEFFLKFSKEIESNQKILEDLRSTNLKP